MKYAVLPCNGLDKSAGPLSREAALRLIERHGGELVCPVLLGNSPDRYAKTLGELPLLVIDGCATQCATKLANRVGAKIAKKIQVADVAKRSGTALGKSPTLGTDEIRLAGVIAASVESEAENDDAGAAVETVAAAADFAPAREHVEVLHDKFVFRVPVDGYFFNENDVWAQISADGRRARVGISDFAQQQLSDISFVGPPTVGAEVEQFGEVGYVESAKATLELVSPVAGRVVAVNAALADSPETVNQSVYERGWVAELELNDFSADRDLLIDGRAYAEIVRKKANEYS